MATGINTDKMNTLKVELLGYIESIKGLSGRLDDCRMNIRNNLSGSIETVIMKQLTTYIEQLAAVNANISTYIQTLNSVERAFENNDREVASDFIRNINKLGQ